MLGPMDSPAPAVAPWIVLGAVLGIALVGLLMSAVVLVRRRDRRPAPADRPPAGSWTDDDLPRFREAPPGSPGAAVHRARPPTGWVSLAPVPPPPSSPAPDPAGRWLAGLAAGVLLVVGAAAAVAATTGNRAAATGVP